MSKHTNKTFRANYKSKKNSVQSSLISHSSWETLKLRAHKSLFLLPNLIKGTVSLISNDLSFIECHVRFTTIPLKPLYDQGLRCYSDFYVGASLVYTSTECT